MIAKPPIILDPIDMMRVHTKKHFADLFKRYGNPIIVVSLLKENAREAPIGNEYVNVIDYINEPIDEGWRIGVIKFDMKKAKQKLGKEQSMQQMLMIAEEALN